MARQPYPSTSLTRVAQQRAEFSRELEQQFAATINERPSVRLDTEAFHIAEHGVRQMATARRIDADQIAMTLRDWLFTLEISDASTIPDLHWRQVHARHPDWRDFARIGVRYVSVATNEANVGALAKTVKSHITVACMRGQSAGYRVPSLDQNHIAIKPRETKNEIRLYGFDRRPDRLCARSVETSRRSTRWRNNMCMKSGRDIRHPSTKPPFEKP
jgi:hypothetical protein